MLQKKITIAICILLLYMGMAGCSSGQTGKIIEQGQTLSSAVGNVVNLEQGWTTETQEAFYYTDQGSKLMKHSLYSV